MPRVLLVLAASLALTGCGARAEESSGDRAGRRAADAQVAGAVEELSDALRQVAWTGEARYLEAQFVDPPPPYNGGSSVQVALLTSTDGHTGQAWEATFVARVRASVEAESAMFGHGAATVARCVEFRVGRADPWLRRVDVSSRGVTCPEGDPLPVESGLPEPRRPAVSRADEQSMGRFLAGGGTADDVAQLQASLTPGLTALAEDHGDVTAIAVTARPDGDDCRVALRDGGAVKVLVPDRTAAMPGEHGCVPRLAILRPPPPH